MEGIAGFNHDLCAGVQMTCAQDAVENIRKEYTALNADIAETDIAETVSALDSLKAVNDSIVEELRNQVQELKLQSIMMQEQLERTGMSAREDSLRQAERIARVDSLRNVTQGAPLVVEGDTLLVI